MKCENCDLGGLMARKIERFCIVKQMRMLADQDCPVDAERRARLKAQLGEDVAPREQRDWLVQALVEEHQCPPLKIVPECPFHDPFAARPSDCRICWLEACEKAAQAGKEK